MKGLLETQRNQHAEVGALKIFHNSVPLNTDWTGRTPQEMGHSYATGAVFSPRYNPRAAS
jgi:hypothetical protein